MKVLVVMKSREERAELARLLAELGIESPEAGSTHEAVTALRFGGDISAVLSGWELTGESGIALLHALRADRRWQDLPVVMVTGADELGQVTQALDAGANEYLMKPYDAEAILEKLLILGVDPERRAAA